MDSATNVIVTGASIDSTTVMTVTGDFFPTADYDAVVSFAGINSSSVSIDDANTLTVTFDNGIPISDVAKEPEVFFWHQTNTGYYIRAYNDIVDFFGISNPMDLTGNTGSPINCSYAGGCNYDIVAPGLASSLELDTNYIDVCGNVCEVVSSDATGVTCSVPAVATSYSVENYSILKSATLTATMDASTPSEVSKLTDGNNMNDYTETATDSCWFSMSFANGYVGTMDEVKFFVSYIGASKPEWDGTDGTLSL